MSRVVSIPLKKLQINRRMMAFLKIMYYFGYLPINWKNEDDPSFAGFLFTSTFGTGSILDRTLTWACC